METKDHKDVERARHTPYRMDDLIPKDHWVRQMENILDSQWIEKKARPFYENAEIDQSPVPLVALVSMQHFDGESSLFAADEKLNTNFAYMAAVGYLPKTRPSLAEICAPCLILPQEWFAAVFTRIILRAVERWDIPQGDLLFPLSQMSPLPRKEAATEMGQAWTDQLFTEWRKIA